MDGVDLNAQQIRGRVSAWVDVDKYRQENFLDATPPDHIDLSITGLFATESTRVPLSTDPEVSVGSTPVNFEAWGYPQDFPSDSYGSNNFLGIGPGLGSPDVDVTATGGLSPYVVTVAGDSSYLNFLLERKHGQSWWVYTIALTPGALFLALALGHGQSRGQAATLGLDAAVGVLAVLPLREVLVPPEVPSLTRVDVLLGLQLMALIGFALANVIRRGPPAQGSGLGWPDRGI